MPKGWLFAVSAVLALSLATPAFAAMAKQAETVKIWSKSDGTEGLTLSSERVKPGSLALELIDTSKSGDHELLIVKTDLKPEQFPLTADGSKVDEKKLKGVHDLGTLKPGQTTSRTYSVKPGTYILFCNEVGQFKAGMYKVLTVAN